MLNTAVQLFESMLPDDTRIKIENIVSGNVIAGREDHCTTIRNLLCSRYPTSKVVKSNFECNAVVKKEQARLIEVYCNEHHFWLQDIPQEDHFLTRGGEARVYIDSDSRHVIKLNDAVYYATWLEFFNSILLHNLIFTNTAYELIGFLKDNDALHAILRSHL